MIATLQTCSICQTFEKLTWGVQRSLWSSRTSRLVSFKTATRLPCADMYHTDVGQGEEKTAYHTCFVLLRRRRTSKSRNRTRCPIKNISLTQITKMTTGLLPHIKSTSARHEKGVQNYIKASWFSRFMQKIELAKVWECKYLKWASCESPQLWITPLPQFFNDSNLNILAQVISHTLSAATPRIAQQRQGKAGSGGGGRRLAEHLQISVRALVGGELLWEH